MNEDVETTASETLTFLFTDIEGSTHLWEQFPDQMSAALREHDALVRSIVQSCNGRVFKTVGDEHCVAFANPADAIRAAHLVQRTLAEKSTDSEIVIALRAALHSGAVEKRSDDYFGQPLNRISRILSIGHSGQILVSQATFDLSRDLLRPEFDFQSLGTHQLRGIEREEPIYQLMHADLRSEFPPLKSNASWPGNLPIPMTTFVGRQKEMAMIQALQKQTRLLTLTGAGGCGKTRLALQVAAESATLCPDGAWLVELAGVSDSDLVPQTAVSAFGLREEQGLSLTETLVSYITNKRVLMVLDNCEHVLDACIDFVNRLLMDCPNLRILATSREALGLAAETSFRVPSMSIPDADVKLTLDQLSGFDSVQLFLDRSRQVRPDIRFHDADVDTIASICRRLDGIPLAIELAAARVRAMPIEQIEQRLDQRFRLLTGGSRSVLARQRTLQSMIDWSHDLLDEIEQALFRRLAVFANGWTLEAAEVVCEDDLVDRFDVLDTLTSLVDKNLVVFQAQLDIPRYTFLESVRQYASDRLLAANELDRFRDRHCDYFVDLAISLAADMLGAKIRLAQRCLNLELDNLRIALTWSLDAPAESDAALKIVGALDFFWVVESRLREGNEWTIRALARPASPSALVMARAYEGAFYLAFFLGDFELAEQMANASLSFGKQANDEWHTITSMFQIGLIDVHRGRIHEAEQIADQGLALAKNMNDSWLIGRHLVLKGLSAWMCSQFDLSRNYFNETLQISRERGDDWHVGVTLSNLAYVTRKSGDSSEAYALHQEGLDLCLRLRDRRGAGWHLVGVAGVCAASEEFIAAARLLGCADGLMKTIGSSLPPPQQDDFDATKALTISALTEAVFAREFSRAGELDALDLSQVIIASENIDTLCAKVTQY